MNKKIIWVFIDMLFMIINYHNYKVSGRKPYLLFVIIFTILAIHTLILINIGW